MVLAETKMIQVANDPTTINQTNQEWGSFGWSVLNLQITHTQDSKTYTRGLDFFTGDSTVETTTINYATITYQRDKKMDNYAEIVRLENEYLAIMAERDEKLAEIEYKDKKISLLFGGVKDMINMVKRITGNASLSKKANAEFEKVIAAYQPRLNQLRMQAEALL